MAMSRITTVHAGATMRPSKLELLGPWLRRQPWFAGNHQLDVVGSFRFEDPDHRVGLDSMFIESNGGIYYVPVTWREAPLPGWAQLIGESQHSVLGRRFCYDALTDPVFIEEATRVITQGDTHSEVHTTEGEVRTPSVEVYGNNVRPDGGRLRAVRRLGTFYPGRAQLIAKWSHNGIPREDVIAAIG
jgi:hypothetical protein